MKKDIQTRQDIETLMQTFYNKLLQDPFMSLHFANTDFSHHLPRIVGFWAFVLFDEQMPIGNVFDAHRHLKIDERHFERWINTFCETVDELFTGKITEKAKLNAQTIGHTFQWKMKFLSEKL
jgi:hemoglobin